MKQGEVPKSYVVTVVPRAKVHQLAVILNYLSLKQALESLSSAQGHPSVFYADLDVYLRSKKRDKKYPPLKSTAPLNLKHCPPKVVKKGREKYYQIIIEFKGWWPSRYQITWKYSTLVEANKHIAWAGRKIKSQQGENADRHQVILAIQAEMVIALLGPVPPLLERFTIPRWGKVPKGGLDHLSGEITK